MPWSCSSGCKSLSSLLCLPCVPVVPCRFLPGAMDPVWGSQEPLSRLQFLAALVPGRAPDPESPEFVQPDGDMDQYLQALQSHAERFVDAELLEDRQELWAAAPAHGPDVPGPVVPDYMYLQGQSRESHLRFQHWAQLVKQDLQCDDRSCGLFQELFSKNPPGAPYGYNEANRVLAHMLKDKAKPQQDLVSPDRPWSGFLSKACREAIEALDCHEHVKDLRNPKKSWEDWGAWATGPPGASSSSSSTWSPYEEPGKGKGKGKFKGKGGKVYHEGKR